MYVCIDYLLCNSCRELYADAMAAVNSGINFDKYDDIPVEASGVDVPLPITEFTGINIGIFLFFENDYSSSIAIYILCLDIL